MIHPPSQCSRCVQHLFTLRRVVIFYLYNDIFSQVLCTNMFIRSRTIILRIFMSISFHLIGFWESWLFNDPLTLILYFTTLRLMDWHGKRGVLSLDISWTYVSNIRSICVGNPKLLVCQCRVLNLGVNGGERKWRRMFPNFLVTLDFPFTYLLVYKPLVSTLWASFAPFSIWRVW